MFVAVRIAASYDGSRRLGSAPRVGHRSQLRLERPGRSEPPRATSTLGVVPSRFRTTVPPSTLLLPTMVRPSTRSKTLYYKRAAIIGGDTAPLADLVEAAVSRESRPLRRAQRFGEENENVQLVNHPWRKGQMICAAFLDFTEGTYQPTIKLDENEIELLIDQIPPREREQFIESMLFFGVQRNHVVLVQSKGLRSGQLERHLNWLLGDCTHVLPTGSHLALLDQPTPEARRTLGPVRKVTMRAPVSSVMFKPEPEEKAKRLSLGDRISRSIWELLNGQGTFLEQLSADEALAIDDIELSLEIRRKSRQRNGTTLLDELAHTLRNTDDEFELETRSGKVLRSGDWRLKTTKRVKVFNGMPALGDVAEKMHGWLAELIEDRQVTEV